MSHVQNPSPAAIIEQPERRSKRHQQHYYLPKNVASYGVAALVALTAVWMGLGDLHKLHHGDSIILSLISQQQWSPYFWETNRYGMLLPLLAKPFANPLTNLIVIVILGIFAGLAASFLLVRYFFDDSIWLMAAALQNIWLLLLVPKDVQFDWFVCQSYGASFALGFAALILLSKQKYLAALVLLLLTHWVNSAAFVVLVPVLLLRHLVTRTRQGLLQSLGLIGISAAAGLAGMRFAHFRNTDTGLLPMSLWPPGWLELLDKTHSIVVPNLTVILWMSVPAALALALLIFTWSGRRALQIAAGFVLIGCGYWLFAGSLIWVRMSTYVPRYVYVSLLLFSLAMAITVVAVFERFLGNGRLLAIASTAVMFAVAASVYGSPSVAKVRRDIDQKFGALTPEVLSSNISLIAGDYWTVWPAVFHANLVLYERGEHRRIYGLSYRDQNTFPDWANQHSLCVGVPLQDHGADFWMVNSPGHFTHQRRLSSLDVFCEP